MAITRRRRLVVTAAVLMLLLPACVAPALGSSKPAPYALIFGTVWGAGERPLYGIRVKLRLAKEKKFRWEAVSDHRGEFAIHVPAAKADYVLVPDLKRTKHKLPETRIHVENDERVDIGVHLQE
ncbi:MAG TPA: hypothetical protein VM578_11340 [Candidatus Saccharimonadales bacterium]|nr:hypothetical protein [Candidatus Saccharimonadales bacterium]